MPFSRMALSFTRDINSIHTIEDLNDAATHVLAAFGVTCFSANLISAPGRAVEPGILFGRCWAEWSQIYRERRYAALDPALRMLRRQATPFTWSEAQAQFGTTDGAAVIRHCLEFTGCAEGLVVPVRDRDGALLTAAFSGPNLQIHPDARAMLHLIGQYYVGRGRDLLCKALLDSACPLTARQIECLKWVWHGKSSSEIGLILGISPHTVHIHIETAKDLLGVSRRSLAAQVAWRSGWFD